MPSLPLALPTSGRQAPPRLTCLAALNFRTTNKRFRSAARSTFLTHGCRPRDILAQKKTKNQRSLDCISRVGKWQRIRFVVLMDLDTIIDDMGSH